MANRKPLIGEAFDAEQMNESERVAAYIAELEYYGRRRFLALIQEGNRILADLQRIEAGQYSKTFIASEDVYQVAHEFKDACESALTDWARQVTRNDYIFFGPADHCGSVGFFYAVESALEDCDIRLEAGDSVPRGFSGMAAFITDHGNVTVETYSRGRKCRELFSVV